MDSEVIFEHESKSNKNKINIIIEVVSILKKNCFKISPNTMIKIRNKYLIILISTKRNFQAFDNIKFNYTNSRSYSVKLLSFTSSLFATNLICTLQNKIKKK